MVFVKVSDGREIRKLQITDRISFAELKQRVADLFPSLGEGSDFVLRYYDSDGDVIALSTDGELQTALAHLPKNAVWRLEIVRPRRTALMRPPSLSAADLSEPRWLRPFDFGSGPDVDPFWTPRSLRPFWHEPMREWDDFSRTADREMERQMERMRRMHQDHMQRFDEQRRKAEEEIRQVMQQQRDRRVERQRSQEAGGGEVAQANRPQWHCQTFGSWEPVTYESPHGQRTVVGPVGYHMYWGYSDPEPMEAEGTEVPKEEEPAKEEAEA